MRTITQKELESDFENMIEYAKANQDGICVISNDGLKSVVMGFDAYQLFIDKKLTISGDNMTEVPLTEAERAELLGKFAK